MHARPVSYLESVIRFLSRLKPDRLGGNILLDKDLAVSYSVFNEPFPTASAGAIMNEFEMRRKVRYHSGGLWRTVGGQKAKAQLRSKEMRSACSQFIPPRI